MCGISGYFSTNPIHVESNKPILNRMRSALSHRGPDGSGIAFFAHAALAHNRLAIIDLAGGHQPMTGASGQTHIVFNGEIYNFQELRSELVGYPFCSRTDTEVILALYEKHGPAGWRRLRGMFAFAVWDAGRNTGFLVRDPMGIKPLFYANTDRLVFGSEAKALFAYGLKPRLNADALHQVMNFRYVLGTSSLFEGVQQLAPGSILTWSKGVIQPTLIAPPFLSVQEDENYSDFSVRHLATLFEQSVSSHLASDVPVGCFLSGGLDSALIARVASSREDFSSYTLDIGDDPQEANNAMQTAAWLGIPNCQQVFAIPDALSAHRDLVRHLETPKVNALQGMLLAEFTSRHVKVALSGLGGDELFYGYNAHRIMWLAGMANRGIAKPVRLGIASTLGHLLAGGNFSERERALEMLAKIPEWARVYGLLRNIWDSPSMRQCIYGTHMLDSNLPDSFAWLTGHFPVNQDPVEAMAKFEINNKLVNDLLWNEDRVSMRAGLETRVPFLDSLLREYVQKLPRPKLMPWGRKKHALRRYAHEVLPDFILNRKKSGFQLDIVSEAQSSLKPLFDEYLSEERLLHHELFNPSFVAKVRRFPATQQFRWHWFILYLMAQTHILIEEFNVE